MKVKYFLMTSLLLMTSMCVVSCGDDDDDNSKTNPIEQKSGEDTAKGMSTGYYSSGLLAAEAKRTMQVVIDVGDQGRLEEMKDDAFWDHFYGSLAFHVVDHQTVELMLEGISISVPKDRKYYKVTDAPIPFYVFFDFDSQYTYKLEGETIVYNNFYPDKGTAYYKDGAIVVKSENMTTTFNRVTK